MPKSVQGESSRKTKRSFGILLPSRRPSYLKSVQGESSRKSKRSFGICCRAAARVMQSRCKVRAAEKTKRSFGIFAAEPLPELCKVGARREQQKGETQFWHFVAEPQIHKARAVMMTFLGIVTSWRGLSQCQFGLFFLTIRRLRHWPSIFPVHGALAR